MTATHCPYCAMQCGMNLHLEEGLPVVAPRPEFPTNRGGLCQKGWTATDLLRHPERLTAPLLRDRKGAPLRPATWDEALARCAAEIRAVQERYGREAVGVFGGGGLTNEKAYLLGKLARVVLRTPNIDYNGRFCMSSAAAAGIRAFGIDRGLPFPLADVARTDALLLVGGNPVECMPPVMQYFDEMQRRGGRLIVVDPRETPTAAGATLHLQITPGTDLALANGLLHVALREGFVDEGFIRERTTGFEEVRRVAAAYWPERVERITGVPVRRIEEAARILGDASTAMVLTARGAEQQSKGTDTALAFINLALALGKAGKPRCGYGCLTGQGNGQGGREHGQKADQLPGYRLLADPAARAHVAGVWGVDPDTLPGPGVSAYELLDGLGTEGGVRALLVFGSNVAVSAPRAAHIEERLRSLDFLAVTDFFRSETAELADLVLPTAQWAEEEGTMTNLEGRVLLRRRAFPPPAGVRTDLEILSSLAALLQSSSCAHPTSPTAPAPASYPAPQSSSSSKAPSSPNADAESQPPTPNGQRPTPSFPTDPQTVFEELRRASAGGPADYSGITYERIEEENGVFWPCPNEAHPGTPRLFEERFPTPDGRARFHPVEYRPAAEEPCGEYPFYLTTGRVMRHYQSGTQTRRVPDLLAAQPDPFVEIHPALAGRFDIGEGERVRVVTRRGEAEVRARVTPAIRQDTLFIPFHWGGNGRANLLTNPALDPISRMPEFKVCAARIEALE